MRKYTIRKGEHEAEGVHLPMLRLGRQGLLKFRIRFSKGCATALSGQDRYDFSKAPGLGCGDHRHESARLGWRGTGTHVELAAFFHVDGHFLPDLRGEKLLGATLPDEWVEVTIAVRKDTMLVSCQGKAVRVKRGEAHWLPVLYTCNPWYGGDQPAPADCVVEVEILRFGR